MSVVVLIVDDNEQNRKLLRDFCQLLGHKVLLATNGLEALELLDKKPDIVLLDIIMPKLDGMETLKRIKGKNEALNIPVIMLSAIDETDVAVECIKNGADDCLPKPFNPIMLEARINGSLQKKKFIDLELKYKDLVEELNENLETQVQKKNKSLYLAHQQLRILDSSKNKLLRMIAHEFNTPMNGMLGAFDYLMSQDSTYDPAKEAITKVFRRSANRLNDLIKQSDILTQATEKSDTIINAYYNLKDLFSMTISSIKDFAETKEIFLEKFPRISKDLEIFGDQTLLYEAFRAVIRTAIKLSNQNEKISFDTKHEQDQFKLSIIVNSMNLPKKNLEELINGFGIEDNIILGEDLGLDPTLVKQVLTLFNGSIQVHQTDSHGIRFDILVPIKS